MNAYAGVLSKDTNIPYLQRSPRATDSVEKAKRGIALKLQHDKYSLTDKILMVLLRSVKSYQIPPALFLWTSSVY